jgi:16S rRNA (cytidine1402-2'-O)-methyltransferase
MQKKFIGTLYIVATPIGNLQDITFRAVEILNLVDRVIAEDTRHSIRLLKHFSIQKPILSLHDFNEAKRLPSILEYLVNGESIALVSDAGTPLISDPGFQLVKAAKQKNIPVVPIPGACAAIAALSASGLPADQFCFEGFLPVKARRQYLQSLVNETRTIIFYEAPHRLLASLEDMLTVFGAEKKAVIAKELTKIHESIRMASLQELFDYYKLHMDEVRGEFVVLLEGAPEKNNKTVDAEAILNILLTELSAKQAASLTSKITGERKNKLYDMAINRK